jgi:hypothetical protein
MKPVRSALLTAGGLFIFLAVALVINGTTAIFQVPVLGTAWKVVMHVAAFPFTLLQRLYRPLVEANPGGMTRILLDHLFYILPPLFWGSVAFAIQKHRLTRTSDRPSHHTT